MWINTKEIAHKFTLKSKKYKYYKCYIEQDLISFTKGTLLDLTIYTSLHNGLFIC